MDIQKLLALVSHDNRGSFEQFYNLYYNQVFRFAYYFLKDKEACREVVLDVFFSVWQSRKKIADVRNIETYLYVVVRNKAKLYSEMNSQSMSLSLSELPLTFESSPDSSPEDLVHSKEIESVLSKAINDLPERCRLIFLMIREEGLKPKQVAEVLSIKESTVRVQMKTAIAKIIEVVKLHYPNISLPLFLIILFRSIF